MDYTNFPYHGWIRSNIPITPCIIQNCPIRRVQVQISTLPRVYVQLWSLLFEHIGEVWSRLLTIQNRGLAFSTFCCIQLSERLVVRYMKYAWNVSIHTPKCRSSAFQDQALSVLHLRNDGIFDEHNWTDCRWRSVEQRSPMSTIRVCRSRRMKQRWLADHAGWSLRCIQLSALSIVCIASLRCIQLSALSIVCIASLRCIQLSALSIVQHLRRLQRCDQQIVQYVTLVFDVDKYLRCESCSIWRWSSTLQISLRTVQRWSSTFTISSSSM